MSARHHVPLGYRAPAIRRAPKPPPPPRDTDEYAAKIIRAVVDEGGWRELLPLPIDGLVLVPSRSEEYADHEVQLVGRSAVRCSGPCGAHPTCFHRVKAALASWQAEHEGWDLSAVCDSHGRPVPAQIHRLIDAYLRPPKRHFVKWWLSSSNQPEEAYAGAEPVGEFV